MVDMDDDGDDDEAPYEPGDDIDLDLPPPKVAPTETTATTEATPAPVTTQAPIVGLSALNIGSILEKVSAAANPTEMTAAMVATLAATASSSGLDEQRRMLLVLTKRVEEQKKMLEMKKGEGKPGSEEKDEATSAADAEKPTTKMDTTPVTAGKSELSEQSPRAESPMETDIAGSLNKAESKEEKTDNNGASILSIPLPQEEHATNFARKRLAIKMGIKLPEDKSPEKQAKKETVEADSDKAEVKEETKEYLEDSKQSIGKVEAIKPDPTKAQSEQSPQSAGFSFPILPEAIQQLFSEHSLQDLIGIAKQTGIAKTESAEPETDKKLQKPAESSSKEVDELESAMNNPGGMFEVMRRNTEKLFGPPVGKTKKSGESKGVSFKSTEDKEDKSEALWKPSSSHIPPELTQGPAKPDKEQAPWRKDTGARVPPAGVAPTMVPPPLQNAPPMVPPIPGMVLPPMNLPPPGFIRPPVVSPQKSTIQAVRMPASGALGATASTAAGTVPTQAATAKSSNAFGLDDIFFGGQDIDMRRPPSTLAKTTAPGLAPTGVPPVVSAPATTVAPTSLGTKDTDIRKLPTTASSPVPTTSKPAMAPVTEALKPVAGIRFSLPSSLVKKLPQLSKAMKKGTSASDVFEIPDSNPKAKELPKLPKFFENKIEPQQKEEPTLPVTLEKKKEERQIVVEEKVLVPRAVTIPVIQNVKDPKDVTPSKPAKKPEPVVPVSTPAIVNLDLMNIPLPNIPLPGVPTKPTAAEDKLKKEVKESPSRSQSKEKSRSKRSRSKEKGRKRSRSRSREKSRRNRRSKSRSKERKSRSRSRERKSRSRSRDRSRRKSRSRSRERRGGRSRRSPAKRRSPFKSRERRRSPDRTRTRNRTPDRRDRRKSRSSSRERRPREKGDDEKRRKVEDDKKGGAQQQGQDQDKSKDLGKKWLQEAHGTPHEENSPGKVQAVIAKGIEGPGVPQNQEAAPIPDFSRPPPAGHPPAGQPSPLSKPPGFPPGRPWQEGPPPGLPPPHGRPPVNLDPPGAVFDLHKETPQPRHERVAPGMPWGPPPASSGPLAATTATVPPDQHRGPPPGLRRPHAKDMEGEKPTGDVDLRGPPPKRMRDMEGKPGPGLRPHEERPYDRPGWDQKLRDGSPHGSKDRDERVPPPQLRGPPPGLLQRPPVSSEKELPKVSSPTIPRLDPRRPIVVPPPRDGPPPVGPRDGPPVSRPPVSKPEAAKPTESSILPVKLSEKDWEKLRQVTEQLGSLPNLNLQLPPPTSSAGPYAGPNMQLPPPTSGAGPYAGPAALPPPLPHRSDIPPPGYGRPPPPLRDTASLPQDVDHRVMRGPPSLREPDFGDARPYPRGAEPVPRGGLHRDGPPPRGPPPRGPPLQRDPLGPPPSDRDFRDIDHRADRGPPPPPGRSHPSEVYPPPRPLIRRDPPPPSRLPPRDKPLEHEGEHYPPPPPSYPHEGEYEDHDMRGGRGRGMPRMRPPPPGGYARGGQPQYPPRMPVPRMRMSGPPPPPRGGRGGMPPMRGMRGPRPPRY